MCLGEQIAPSIYFLRKAWYAFSQLIDIPFEECFICPTCGPSPNVIMCDGTMVGMRKDLLPFKHNNQPQEDPVFPVIKGSAHVDRVLIKSKRARDMLLKYSGYRRDRKPIACPQMVTIKEFDQLVKLLRSDGFSSLAQLLDKLEKNYHERTAPKPYRKFFLKLQEIRQLVEWCKLLVVSKLAAHSMQSLRNPLTYFHLKIIVFGKISQRKHLLLHPFSCYAVKIWMGRFLVRYWMC